LKANKKNISIFIIWLVHISGLLGMVFYDLDFFAGYTSLNLFLMSIILFANIKLNNKNRIFALLLIFLIGMLSEFIGVNYGLIFGEYIYGNNLGFKLFGVPLLIGLNWVILTVICANIASFLIKNNSILQMIIVGTSLMLLIDIVMEPIAPKLDLWKFKNLVVPSSNYIGWLIISILTQTIYNTKFKQKEVKLSFNLYTAIFTFFVFLNLILQ
jgi:putative membrane protein|tara:strand:- start:594 stop:1232 length:639 start_codon:yes stop_codon:yes gene_type:complete